MHLMTTTPYMVNYSMNHGHNFAEGQPPPHAAKPHHVPGYGTSGELATTLVILNGYAYAFITLLCFVLNVITIPVMLHRDIIIPSYIILTAITVSDMLMAVSSLPFNIYFYLFDEYKSFVPFDLCFAQRTFGEVVPSALHTMSIWCTVYLAVHRYREVTTTNAAKRKMSLQGGSASRNDFISVLLHCAGILFFSFFIQCFRFFDTEIIPVRIVSPKDLSFSFLNTTAAPPVVSCSMRLKSFITSTIGKNAYFLAFLWCRTICVQILPCGILIFVNVLLINILNERIEVRQKMIKKRQSNAASATSNSRLTDLSRTQSVQVAPPLLAPKTDLVASSSSAAKNADIALKNWRLITRMLWLIVLITLFVELPFAAWFIYLCIDITAFHFRMPSYIVNIISSSLNIMLLMTTPLKFIIYLTMIRPFRDRLAQIKEETVDKFWRGVRWFRNEFWKTLTCSNNRCPFRIVVRNRRCNQSTQVPSPAGSILVTRSPPQTPKHSQEMSNADHLNEMMPGAIDELQRRVAEEEAHQLIEQHAKDSSDNLSIERAPLALSYAD